MTINERIRYFRKEVLKMNQTDFALKLGMKQTSVSTFEKPGATVTDPTIKSLCLAFNLNENWIRHGIEPMYAQPSEDEFAKAAASLSNDEFVRELIINYWKLDEDSKKLFRKFIGMLSSNANEHEQLNSPAKPMKQTSTEDSEAKYIKSRSNIAQNTGSSASNTIADVIFPTNKTDKASNQ